MEIAGFTRMVQLVNNQYPGPTLTANWGDTLVVNVKNGLQDNGTSMHWHGLRQLNSCQHDGANGVTECPIAPGQTKQYRMKCTQFGTSWYHSHFSAQYAEGVVGTIIINGPATANYDVDLGTLPITDWFHDTAFMLNHRALHSTTGPPVPNNALINGTMKSPDGTRGKYHKVKITKGKKYRIRFVNTAVHEHFQVSIDGHNMTVITSDLVPIRPFTAQFLSMNVGQRYDVVVDASQAVGNYWIRADTDTACSTNANRGNVKAILSYEGANDADPTTAGPTPPSGCFDMSVTPYVSNTVPQDQFASAMQYLSMDFNVSQSVTGPLVQWWINGSGIDVDWSRPTLQYVIDGDTNYDDLMNVFEIEGVNKWTFWVIQTVQGDPVNVPHPIHLHGHDFYILGSGNGVWNGDSSALKFVNPTRRDTATLPGGGYLILAFPADNPGAWLMHCHIAWHVGQGFSLQFLERKAEILGAIGDMSSFGSGCDSWRSYWEGPHPYEKDDSGL
ncbi:MAG: hypothetical protein M1822_000277 [Bathelium mastoideum]|nr:MAG: hypothetical protein M1822_000277 [Bathelium mastoideum]